MIWFATILVIVGIVLWTISIERIGDCRRETRLAKTERQRLEQQLAEVERTLFNCQTAYKRATLAKEEAEATAEGLRLERASEVQQRKAAEVQRDDYRRRLETAANRLATIGRVLHGDADQEGGA